MSTRVQRVLMIQDASRPLHTDVIRWALRGLHLKPGDKIKFLRVVLPIRNANISSFMGCAILRNKIKLHTSATIMKKQESIEYEATEKLDEIQKNAEIKELLKLNEMQQIEFIPAIETGESLKEVTVQAAKVLNATCVILDRKMKKDQKYVLDNLSCGILRMKHDGGVEHLREPITTEIEEMPPARTRSSNVQIEIFRGGQQEDILEKSICSVCNNKRPKIGLLSREFSFSELKLATNGFSQQNLLSKHGKEIYRGRLIDGLKIVIRKHSSTTIKEEEFNSRVRMLGKARHENVAMLLGSFSEGHNRLLVYEYVCNGSLSTHLSEKISELTWERRLKIAKGTARGLEYLHGKGIYGHMRPNNILITHDYVPLLANFGLTRNQYEDSGHSSRSRVLKTFEYLAPEYEETGIDSSKTDIYSFGVVLLELITGRKTIQDTKGETFLRWARPLLIEKKYGDLIDPVVLESHDLHQLFCMVRLAEKCLSSNPHSRHSMEKVVNSLTLIIQGQNNRDFSPTEYELIEQLKKMRK